MRLLPLCLPLYTRMLLVLRREFVCRLLVLG
jgi:hypothetical protein